MTTLKRENMRKNESMEQENMRKLGGISRGGKE